MNTAEFDTEEMQMVTGPQTATSALCNAAQSLSRHGLRSHDLWLTGAPHGLEAGVSRAEDVPCIRNMLMHIIHHGVGRLVKTSVK